MYQSVHVVICLDLEAIFEFHARKMVHWLKVFATKPDDWNSIPRTHMVGGEHNSKLFSDLHVCVHTHMHTYTQSKFNNLWSVCLVSWDQTQGFVHVEKLLCH